ncbi:ABC transporter ATP-binding protein [Candidatus Hydrogenedentota bacterium]
MDALVIEEVDKTFGATRAVDKLSAKVPPGSIYGFLGPNGAGKTTTIRMIMDIIRPDSGRISLFGVPSTNGCRERVGYMPEERGLYRKMTVNNFLAYIGRLKGMSRGDVNRAAPHWLEKVGLSDWSGKRVEELSRGMQQKIQFVTTVINDPDLLILDEPFSGLDPVNLDLLKSVMLEMRDDGKTVLFSTHMMDHAERLCDFIMLINDGRKVIDGPLDSIREGYASDSVLLETDSDTAFVGELPIVTSVSGRGKTLEIVLKDGADPQELLKILVDRVRVKRFETKVPTLHEIFVDLVGDNHE